MRTLGEPRTGLVDLAARRLSGMVLAANDEYFAAKENLLDPRPPSYDPTRYSDRGKEMDGWETRRRRTPGHDWCLVRLGVPGIVRAVVVDTTHFRGNCPEACSLDGAAVRPGVSDGLSAATWFPLLERTPLEGDSAQRFEVTEEVRVTHVRLNIHPDGGVARLRLLGEPLVALGDVVGAGGRLDLAATTSGGLVVGYSDAFFSAPSNLIGVGDALDMGDGWETRRRRGPGHDWVAVRLAAEGLVERVEIDTTHFKGNRPDRVALDLGHATDDAGPPPGRWTEVLPAARLEPHARHTFEVVDPEPATHARLRIMPDGGLARLRLFGEVTDAGRRRAGLRMLDALEAGQARAALTDCCASSAWVEQMLRRRPFREERVLLRAAEDVWWGLGPDDWREAFAAHPRIGERPDEEGRHGRWSLGEQAGAADAGERVQAALDEGNRAYEQRFGHVFLICAAGRDAEEILTALRTRLAHEPAEELRVAAAEQAAITRLRLERLLTEGGGA